MVRIALPLTAVLAALPFLSAHPALPSVVSRNLRGGCVAEPPAEFISAAIEISSLDDAEFSSLSDDGIEGSVKTPKLPIPVRPIIVKTWMHVVAASKKPEDGWLSQGQLWDQFQVLNENFAPQKVKFILQGITRTVNANWSVDAPGAELEMKKKLRKGGYSTLNLYSQKALRRDALGYAYFPGNVTKGSDDFYYDGATINYDTVPGGNLTNYNLGKTATHEVGHWLGLLHTFEGDSCTGENDWIADTPAQAGSTSGCPIGADTCPAQEGLDPIHNYMDYSYDTCYEEFTPLQTKRIFDMWKMFRGWV